MVGIKGWWGQGGGVMGDGGVKEMGWWKSRGGWYGSRGGRGLGWGLGSRGGVVGLHTHHLTPLPIHPLYPHPLDPYPLTLAPWMDFY